MRSPIKDFLPAGFAQALIDKRDVETVQQLIDLVQISRKISQNRRKIKALMCCIIVMTAGVTLTLAIALNLSRNVEFALGVSLIVGGFLVSKRIP